MGYALELELAIHATDANQILGVNKFKKHKTFKKVMSEVAYLCRGKEPSIPLRSFSITAHRFSQRFMDHDNFASLMKPYVDGLKLCGVIIDDSWEYIKEIPKEQTKIKRKETPKLIIKVIGNE